MGRTDDFSEKPPLYISIVYKEKDKKTLKVTFQAGVSSNV